MCLVYQKFIFPYPKQRSNGDYVNMLHNHTFHFSGIVIIAQLSWPKTMKDLKHKSTLKHSEICPRQLNDVTWSWQNFEYQLTDLTLKLVQISKITQRRSICTICDKKDVQDEIHILECPHLNAPKRKLIDLCINKCLHFQSLSSCNIFLDSNK